MTKESRSRSRVRTGGKYARHNYRYRRYQALNDALDMYFVLFETKGWMTISDICEELEWNESDHAVRKRVRRMAEALVRVERVQIKRRPGKFMIVRAYKKGIHDAV